MEREAPRPVRSSARESVLNVLGRREKILVMGGGGRRRASRVWRMP